MYPEKLSEDQEKAWDIISKRKNVFITAKAGAGKSFLLNYVKSNFQGRVLVTASTGIAANAIGGRTLHSQFRINPNSPNISDSIKSMRGSAALSIIRAADLLLIDEISMVSEGLLQFVDLICQKVRGRTLPFGGLQLAFFGDFLQLPPVSKNNYPNEASCWDGDCWKSANLQTVLLTTNFRQKDDEDFFEILNNLRYNRLTEKDKNVLYTRCITPSEEAVRLFATNQEVDTHNARKFSALDPATEHSYVAVESGKPSLIDAYWRNSIMPQELVLRLGARVMMCINKNTDHGYLFNGATGEVIGYDDAGFPLVEFDSGLICVIKSEIIYSYIVKDGNDVVVESAQISHVPLKLAWACTVHKSQGQTFDSVAIDCAKVFDYGQVYVAMSRARSLKGLYISNLSLSSKGAMSDPFVVDKYLELENANKKPEGVIKKPEVRSLVAKYFS